MVQIIDDQISRQTAALLEIRSEVVPAPVDLRRHSEPVLDHREEQMVDAVETEGGTGDVEDVAKKMEQSLEGVWLISFRGYHRRARQSFDQQIPDSQYTAGFVHTLQSHGMTLVDPRQYLVRYFGYYLVGTVGISIESRELEVRYRRIDVLRNRGDLYSLGGVENRTGRHSIHRREDVAAVQQVLEALEAETHPSTVRTRADVLTVMTDRLVGLLRDLIGIPVTSDVLQQTQYAVESGVREDEGIVGREENPEDLEQRRRLDGLCITDRCYAQRTEERTPAGTNLRSVGLNELAYAAHDL